MAEGTTQVRVEVSGPKIHEVQCLIDKGISCSGTLQVMLSQPIFKYNDLSIDLKPAKFLLLISTHCSNAQNSSLHVKITASHKRNGVKKTQVTSCRVAKTSQGQSRARA